MREGSIKMTTSVTTSIGAAMKETSIREAKSKLTSLIHEVESGHPVRLTRRGKPVAVLVSDRHYEKLLEARKPRQNFLQFLQGWRREMIAKGLAFDDTDDVAVGRDRRPGREFSFDK
jgi:prevent-host-death family protein